MALCTMLLAIFMVLKATNILNNSEQLQGKAITRNKLKAHISQPLHQLKAKHFT